MKARLAFVLAGLVAAEAVGRAEVEFAGYMRTPQGEVKFVLADATTRQTSEWLGVGGSFAGYRVTGFEAKGELLAVEKDGVSRHLRLKHVATTAPTPASTGTTGSRPPSTEEEARAIEESKRLYVTLRSNVVFLHALKERKANVAAGVLPWQTSPDASPLSAERQSQERQALEYLDTTIAKLTQEIARDTLEQDRNTRILLLKRMREVEGDPQRLAPLQGDLRELDARLAKAAAQAPAAPP